jgi:hypothetical protein
MITRSEVSYRGGMFVWVVWKSQIQVTYFPVGLCTTEKYMFHEIPKSRNAYCILFIIVKLFPCLVECRAECHINTAQQMKLT